jgi:hypothetical protein
MYINTKASQYFSAMQVYFLWLVTLPDEHDSIQMVSVSPNAVFQVGP